MKGSSRKGGRPATWIGGGGLDPKQLAGLGIPQLKALFQEIFGQPTSSNNAKWLRHKLAQPPRPGNSSNAQPHGGRSMAPLPPLNNPHASAKHSSPSSEQPLYTMDHAPVPEHESLPSLDCPRLPPGQQHISVHEYAIEQAAADATATLHQRPQGSRMTSKRKTSSSAGLAAAAAAAEGQRPTRRAKVPGLETMSAEYTQQQQMQERGTAAAAAAMTSCNGLDVHRSPSNGSSSEWWQHSEDPMLLGAEAASHDVAMGDAPAHQGHHSWYGEAGPDVLSWASDMPLSMEDHWESLGQPFGQHSFESSSTEPGLPGYYSCGLSASISMADAHMGSRGMLPGMHLQRPTDTSAQQGGFCLHQASRGTGHLPSWPEHTGTVTTCQAWSDYRVPRSDAAAAAAAAAPAAGTFSITHDGLPPPLGQTCLAPPQLTPEDESLRLAGPSISMARASCLAPATLQGDDAVATLGCEDPLLDMLFSDWGINGPAAGCGKVEPAAWNTAGQPQLAWGTQNQHWLD